MSHNTWQSRERFYNIWRARKVWARLLCLLKPPTCYRGSTSESRWRERSPNLQTLNVCPLSHVQESELDAGTHWEPVYINYFREPSRTHTPPRRLGDRVHAPSHSQPHLFFIETLKCVKFAVNEREADLYVCACYGVVWMHCFFFVQAIVNRLRHKMFSFFFVVGVSHLLFTLS